MNEKRAKKLFNKYLNNECSPEEKELLERFLDSFQDNKKLWSELKFDEEIKAKVWSNIQTKTTIKKNSGFRNFKLSNLIKYAAVIAGFAIVIGFYLSTNLNNSNKNTLTIEDEKVVIRTGVNTYNMDDVGATGQISNDAGEPIAFQEGDVIVYKQKDGIKELVYNEIEVPKGKTFKLMLSDGTAVYLNSSTIFRFPVNFIKGEERKVFLKGEAFFEVARDVDHPFLVNANDMDVQVLGTHFVVSSYNGSPAHTVLIEGSVAIKEHGDITGLQKIIVPGQKGSLISGNIQVEEVNVADYVGWVQGTLIFNNEPFSEIIKKIERKYNVTIQNNYKDLANVRFNGKFKEETIIDLLETFKESAGFDFYISDNKVIINKKETAYDMKHNQ